MKFVSQSVSESQSVSGYGVTKKWPQVDTQPKRYYYSHKKNLSLDVCNLFSSSPCLMCIWWYYKEKQQKNIQNAIHPITISLLWQRYFLIYVRLRVKISASVAIFDFFGYKVICWRNHLWKALDDSFSLK